MALLRSIKRFLLISAVAITGLTLFHHYVEDKSTSQSVSEATTQYIGFIRWVTRRMEFFGTEMSTR